MYEDSLRIDGVLVHKASWTGYLTVRRSRNNKLRGKTGFVRDILLNSNV